MNTMKYISFNQARWPFFCILSLGIGLLGGGCAPGNALPPETTAPAPAASTSDAQAENFPAQTPAPTAVLDAETQAVFTIANEAPNEGVAGASPPDWLAWGAPAFAVAPDGSFWILDTAAAHPPRLLQFSADGALQVEIPLEGKVAGAVDMAVSGDTIWVLGLASHPAQIVSFDAGGQVLNTFSIPEVWFEHEGDTVYNLLDDLLVGEQGELLLKGFAGSRLYEFLDTAGEISGQRLEAYAFAGHLYRVGSHEYGMPGIVYVDDLAIEIPPASPGNRVGSVDLLGVNPDGGFFLAVIEEIMDDGETTGFLQVVHAFTLTGEHLGVSIPPEGAVWVDSNRDLALGSDGALYALVSREDHSVDVLRLSFAPEASMLTTPVPTLIVSPVLLTPLLPAWTTPPVGASDLEIARNTLLVFFTYLHDEKFAEAAALYGGPLDAVVVPDPESAGGDPGRFWEQACFLLQCLLVADIVEEERVAADEFRFVVEFIWDDGTRFTLGPCCGASEADMPPVWRFPYTVKEIEGRFVVMEPPQYVP